MSIKPRILLAGAASLLTLIACNSNNPAQSNAAATVNGTAISTGLVDMVLKQNASAGQMPGAEARVAVIDRLAMQLLMTQEAVKKGLDKAPELADQIEMNRQSLLVNAFIQDYVKNNPVSDDTLAAEYEKIKAQMAGTEYKARHILVEKESEAKDIIARLKKTPKAFDALARERSRDPGSKGKGGDLGWVDPRGMVPEFGAALPALGKGKFSEEPVKTQFGYHVVLVEDSRPTMLPPLEQIKPALKQQVQEQNLRKLLDEMKAKAKIEIAQAPAAAPAAPAAPAAESRPAAPAKK
jgi:peptidyl-prolyl cis-trans isomerase C